MNQLLTHIVNFVTDIPVLKEGIAADVLFYVNIVARVAAILSAVWVLSMVIFIILRFVARMFLLLYGDKATLTAYANWWMEAETLRPSWWRRLKWSLYGGVHHELQAEAEQAQRLMPASQPAKVTLATIGMHIHLEQRQGQGGVEHVSNVTGGDGLMYSGKTWRETASTVPLKSSMGQCLCCSIQYLKMLGGFHIRGLLIVDILEWHWFQVIAQYYPGGHISQRARDEILIYATVHNMGCVCSVLESCAGGLHWNGFLLDAQFPLMGFVPKDKHACRSRQRLAIKVNDVLGMQLRVPSGNLTDRLREWSGRQYYVGSYLVSERGLPTDGAYALVDFQEFVAEVQRHFLTVAFHEMELTRALLSLNGQQREYLKMNRQLQDFQSGASTSLGGPQHGRDNRS